MYDENISRKVNYWVNKMTKTDINQIFVKNGGIEYLWCSLEWAALNFNQILTSRQVTFRSLQQHKHRVGLNALANRFFILNDKIPLEWFNMSMDTFKVNCKKRFLLCT